MKKSIPIPILSVAVTAVIAVTACGTPRTIHDVGPSSFTTSPSPTAACTQAPGEAPCPGGAGVWRPTTADSAISAAKRFGAESIDAVAARGALESGRPFLVGLPDGGNVRCHSALLVPSDPKVWILNSAAVSSAGRALDRELLQYGCDDGTVLPEQVLTPALSMFPSLDEAAKAAAAASRVPFLYALSDHSEPACRTAVVLPDGATWFLNRSGGASAEGDALERTLLQFGCVSGVERPEGGVR